MRFLLRLLLNAVAIMLAAYIVPGLSVTGFAAALVAALSAGTGLMRDELHAEHLAGERAHLVDRAGELDAAALAASAGVDLRLDDPDRPAELLRGLDRLVDRERRNAARHRNAEAAKELLALVFVDLHVVSSVRPRRDTSAGKSAARSHRW